MRGRPRVPLTRYCTLPQADEGAELPPALPADGEAGEAPAAFELEEGAAPQEGLEGREVPAVEGEVPAVEGEVPAVEGEVPAMEGTRASPGSCGPLAVSVCLAVYMSDPPIIHSLSQSMTASVYV